MISKRLEFGKVEILSDGVIQLREDTIYEEDGKLAFKQYHRRVLEPNNTHIETDKTVVGIINLKWTPEIIEEYKRKKKLAEESLLGSDK